MKKIIYFPLIIGLFCLMVSCNKSDHANTGNPAAAGFNAAGSDAAAVALADKVMAAMGGRKAWDQAHYLAWNFFGMRHLIWDKKTGDVRIDFPQEDLTILVNINTLEGKVKKGGAVITHADSLEKYLEKGKNIWINDAYWLFMPFKLKDSGVTLHYLGEDTTQAGSPAEVIALTFDHVGHTPQNKYHVYIDKDSHLVSQWAYFANANQEKPNFVLPWQNYEQYDGILLSGDRGERKLTDIKVMEAVPSKTFTDLSPVTL